MTNYSLKMYLEELFDQLKFEWSKFNIPQHHKEIYAELLRQIPKDQAVSFIQKEIQKVKNNQSFVQECMLYIDQREQGLEQLRQAVDQFEVSSDNKVRENLVEMISQLLVHLRQISVFVVESICKWKDHMQLYLSNLVDEKKQPFIIAYSYNNDNYLLKIQTDMLEYSDRSISQYFNFSNGIDPFLMNLTLTNELRPNQITHFIPKTTLKRIEHLQERLQKELQFSEENEKQQQNLLYNPNATQYSQQTNSNGSSLMKLKSIKYRRTNLKTQSTIQNSKQFIDMNSNEKIPLSRKNFRQRSLQPPHNQFKRFDSNGSPNSSIRNSPQNPRIKNLPKRYDKSRQLEEISIQACMFTEDQLQLYIKDYFDQFKGSVDEENPFLKSFPFDHIEVMTEVKTQQETNVFLIHFRDYQDKKGLLITHIDRYNFDERKLIISHLSILNLEFESEIFLYEKTLTQLKKFLFQNDPCSEIQIALVTFEKDDIMFGVNEAMESVIKQSQFIQVEFQDDYETQLYYYKRPQNLPKKQQLQQIEPVFFELQSCITLRDQQTQATPNSLVYYFLFNSIFIKKETNSINNGSVNIALLCDLLKGELKQQIQSIECDWQKVEQFENLSKEFELIRDIQHSDYQTANDLNDYLNRQNSIFDFTERLKEKKQIYYSNTEQYFRWNSSQQIIIDELPYVRINYVRQNDVYYPLNANGQVYFNRFIYHFNLIVKYLKEIDQQQKDFDELCIDLGQREINLQELNPIEDGKNIVFPQFSLKQKRERNVTDSLIMYEQLIFSNDFEPTIKSIKYKPYDSNKDILIMKPFVFGMLNLDILSELDSILFAGVYKK